MKIIKIRGVIKEFGTMDISRHHATVFRQVLEQPQAQMNLQICWKEFVDSLDEVMAAAPLLSENDWHKDELLMAHKSADEKRLQRCRILLLTTFLIAFWNISLALCTLHKYPLIGAKLLSICCQNMAVRGFLLSTGPLRASAFCTKRLLI